MDSPSISEQAERPYISTGHLPGPETVQQLVSEARQRFQSKGGQLWAVRRSLLYFFNSTPQLHLSPKLFLSASRTFAAIAFRSFSCSDRPNSRNFRTLTPITSAWAVQSTKRNREK